MATKKRPARRPAVTTPIFYDGPPSQGSAPLNAGAAAEARFNFYARQTEAQRRTPRRPRRRRGRGKP